MNLYIRVCADVFWTKVILHTSLASVLCNCTAFDIRWSLSYCTKCLINSAGKVTGTVLNTQQTAALIMEVIVFLIVVI